MCVSLQNENDKVASEHKFQTNSLSEPLGQISTFAESRQTLFHKPHLPVCGQALHTSTDLPFHLPLLSWTLRD